MCSHLPPLPPPLLFPFLSRRSPSPFCLFGIACVACLVWPPVMLLCVYVFVCTVYVYVYVFVYVYVDADVCVCVCVYGGVYTAV